MKKYSLFLSAAAVILFSGCSSIVPEKNSAPAATPATAKPAKTATYSKAIAAPYLKGQMVIDGVMDEANWKNAGFFDDFIVFRKKKMPDSKTEVRVFHDGEYLYFGMKCYDKREDTKPIDKGNLWSGDCIELFLGGMDPEPSAYQLCWGSGVKRYSPNENWEHKSKIIDKASSKAVV